MTSTYLKKIFPVTWKNAYATPTYTMSVDTSNQYISNTITPFTIKRGSTVVYTSDSSNVLTFTEGNTTTNVTILFTDNIAHINGWTANNVSMVSGAPILIKENTTFTPNVTHTVIHRDTQGPCPNGFHIGTQDEWTSIKTALTTLGLWDKTNFMTYLKIPSAYYLNRSNGSKNTGYGPVRFWTSTMTSKTVAYCMYVNEKNSLAVATDKPANGFSIRPFKDTPETPDNSWTLLVTGIYWNSTLGLISITGDSGANWITISDKNLGATNVGDNGLYYQFGNNNGFTVSPSSSYTSTKNATGYGPGNYYNDSHFVKVSSNNWMSSDNNNIWGGVSNGTWESN